jgi:hypothetical protein
LVGRFSPQPPTPSAGPRRSSRSSLDPLEAVRVPVSAARLVSPHGRRR